MKKIFIQILTILPLFLSMAMAQDASHQQALPYSPSLDLKAMDTSADPCVDFYQYSCGGWMKRNPLPADQSSWSVYAKLYEDNLVFLRGILERAAADTGMHDQVNQEIGGFYAACMDEAAIEKRGTAPMQQELVAIARLKSGRQLAPLLARLELSVPNSSIAFGGGSEIDPDNSAYQIASLDQGGLGLPDRDYYTNNDEKTKETQQRYLLHVQKIFELLGDSPEVAKQNAAVVMRMETVLAKSSQTLVERREPYSLRHKMKLAEVEELAPNFRWKAYFHTLKSPHFEIVNVVSPDFFKEFNRQIADEPIGNWKQYLRFHVADGYAPYLSSKFVQEDFDFHSKYLRGTSEMQPRWKRCVRYVDDYLGEALGQAYVDKVFSPELKASTEEMVRRIEAAMEQRIDGLDWMSPATKQLALAKLHNIRNKIGYPDRWRDYSSVKIVHGDFAGNVRRAGEFESRREINKIGKPVDHNEWSITPPTVDAYFDPQRNDINFPAGVLQPPLYDPRMDDAPNYGDTGGTIGHELTHGFDDEGRKFDANGNLKDWWTKGDAEKFDQRVKCVQDQYSDYVAVDDVHVNGKLTLGENVADLGGEILAYIAWKQATGNKNLQPIDDLTPDQRFFVGFAQWACENQAPESLRLQALTNPHSPAIYRVNGIVVNMPEFAHAFSCKAGQPMVKPSESICKVW